MRMRFRVTFLLLLLSGICPAQSTAWTRTGVKTACGELLVRYVEGGIPPAYTGKFEVGVDGVIGTGCQIAVRCRFLASRKDDDETITQGTTTLTAEKPVNSGVTGFGIREFRGIEISYASKTCGCVATTTSAYAEFLVSYHNAEIKSATFRFVDKENPDSSFEAASSSGNGNAANNPYTQTFKDMGTLPAGSWVISSVTDKGLVKLRLLPTSNVTTNGRNGMRIHGTGTGKTPAQSSAGCIILTREYRLRLLRAMQRYGTIPVTVKNQLY